jgi:alkanesulfonate monooxygenase SsuD/methylene tetrahydromethanopterin reductase-like flavin-dependent oxidoreductase (luciferase family)
VERDPITTAKEVATLDLVSRGRCMFGIGAGWNLEEMRNHGTDPERRFGLMRERVEAMKAIWAEEEAEYHGKQVDFDPIWSYPKPVQKPHPPIIIGGNGKKAPDRVRSYGDEWMPNRIGDDEKTQARIRKLGKPVTLSAAPTKPATIEAYEEAGVHRCVWYVPPGGRDVVETALDQYTAARDAYSG